MAGQQDEVQRTPEAALVLPNVPKAMQRSGKGELFYNYVEEKHM